MAERRAQQKYYPPEWDPRKGSLNTFHGQHPLRERARRLASDGILVVRFELPFNVWCGGCGAHIERGVRYNADKKKAGMYYSTPVWSFRMKCHLCENHFEIQTDPKNAQYVVVEGARRKNEEFPAEDAGLEGLQLLSPEERERLRADPMLRLEHTSEDQRRAAEQHGSIRTMAKAQAQRADSYAMNSMLRRRFRDEKHARHAQAVSDDAFRAKLSLGGLPLQAESHEDAATASAAMMLHRSAAAAARPQRHQLAILDESIFRPSGDASVRRRARSTPTPLVIASAVSVHKASTDESSDDDRRKRIHTLAKTVASASAPVTSMTSGGVLSGAVVRRGAS
jgi:coiled-coil domain-containing protein 130